MKNKSFNARKLITLFMLLIYVLSSAGCAVVWFVVGAGAAATAFSVMDENEKEKAKKD